MQNRFYFSCSRRTRAEIPLLHCAHQLVPAFRGWHRLRSPSSKFIHLILKSIKPQLQGLIIVLLRFLCTAMLALFIAFFLPETKGKAQEEARADGLTTGRCRYDEDGGVFMNSIHLNLNIYGILPVVLCTLIVLYTGTLCFVYRNPELLL
jgi:hypothetical protein